MRTIKTVSAVLLTLAVIGTAACAQGTFPGTGSKGEWLKANGFFAEGNHFMHLKKYAEAATKYEQAIAIYPSDYHYHFNLALALKRKGEAKAASEAFRKALDLDSHDWRCWKGLGNCLYKLGDLHGAGDAFEHAIQSNPPAKEVAELNAGIAACRAH